MLLLLLLLLLVHSLHCMKLLALSRRRVARKGREKRGSHSPLLFPKILEGGLVGFENPTVMRFNCSVMQDMPYCLMARS
jgi:hypothetical protein